MADPNIDPHELAVKPHSTTATIIGDLLTCGAPAALLAAIGYGIGNAVGHPFIGALLAPMPFLGTLIGLGLKFPHQQEFLVIERFNKFRTVLFGFDRPRLINPILDRVAFKDDFKAKSFALYATGTDEDRKFATLDFTDGSAPIKATGWYTIGRQSYVSQKNGSALTTQIALYTYTYTPADRLERIKKVYDSELRPRLQSLCVDEVSTNGESVIEKAAEAACKDLAFMGVNPLDTKSITIDDVELTQEVIELRELELKGKRQAAEVSAAMAGPVGAIKAIQAMAPEGEPMSVADAQEFFLKSKALDVIAGKTGDLNFVSPDVSGVLVSLGAAKKGS